jgi:hypothetical protein
MSPVQSKGGTNSGGRVPCLKVNRVPCLKVSTVVHASAEDCFSTIMELMTGGSAHDADGNNEWFERGRIVETVDEHTDILHVCLNAVSTVYSECTVLTLPSSCR